jgi:hypothetical protein
VGVALGDRVSGQDQRTLRSREHGGGRLHRGAVAPDPRRHARGRAQLDDTLGLEDVRRQRQEDRPRRGRQRGLRRSVNQPRQVLEPTHLRRPLHKGARDRGKVGPEDRLGDVECLVVLARGYQEGRSRLLGVVEHPERVAEAGRHVDADDPELAGGLGVAVGHRDHRGLLEREHVRESGRLDETVHERQLGRSRVPEEVLDTLLKQHLQEGALP